MDFCLRVPGSVAPEHGRWAVKTGHQSVNAVSDYQ